MKDCTLYNQILSDVKQHPYLGVLLSSDLRWNSHVNDVVKKANSTLGFVNRNLYSCSEVTKRAAYVTLVRPHLEYASAVWDPYRQEQVDKIEAVQRRAVRFIKQDYDWNSSVTQMQQSLSLDQLRERRKAHRLKTFHLAVNNNIAAPIPEYYQHSERYTRSYTSTTYIQLRARHDYYLYSFFPRTIKDWNCLPIETRAQSYPAFCAQLNKLSL